MQLVTYLIIKRECEEQTLNSVLELPTSVLSDIAKFQTTSFRKLVSILKEYQETDIFIIPIIK